MMHKDSLGHAAGEWDHAETPMGQSGPEGEMFPSEAWVFTPTADIKAKEIAEIMALFHMGLPQDYYDKVPPHLKKHFKFKKFEM